IRAHSTRRPLPAGSPYKDHWQLCYERSLSTMRFLREHGIEPDRIRLSQAAAYEPLTTRLEANWQDENNCAEIFVLMSVADHWPAAPPVDSPSGPEPGRVSAASPAK